MREIKFRAWMKNRLSGEWFMDYQDSGTPESYYLHRFFENYDAHHEVFLMQYTGLKDKTSKEIYEGDIIKKSSMDSFGYEVYWHMYTACWMLRHPHRSGFTGIDKGDCALMCEVIGNIYENPELVAK